MKEILTVNDLINELKKFDGNKKIMVSDIDDNEYCHKINNIFETSIYDYKENISEEKLNKKEKTVFIGFDLMKFYFRH